MRLVFHACMCSEKSGENAVKCGETMEESLSNLCEVAIKDVEKYGLDGPVRKGFRALSSYRKSSTIGASKYTTTNQKNTEKSIPSVTKDLDNCCENEKGGEEKEKTRGNINFGNVKYCYQEDDCKRNLDDVPEISDDVPGTVTISNSGESGNNRTILNNSGKF